MGRWKQNVQVDICRRGGQEPRATQDQRHVDVPPYTHGVPPCKQPRDEGGHGADEPEPLQAAVDGARAEDAPRADGAPDDARRVKDLLARTSVLVRLVIRAVAHEPNQYLSRVVCVCVCVCWEGGRRGGKNDRRRNQVRQCEHNVSFIITYHTSGMLASAQFMTAICTMADHMLATSCDENMVRGGTFM